MTVKEVLLVILVMPTGIIAEVKRCGRLLENQLYNDKTFAEQDEHPWLGRILYRDANKSTTSYRCTVVLLNPRHGLAPALCVDGRSIRENTPFAVMLGDQSAPPAGPSK
ncbi:GM23131 [Drosophila sechellia]|uniref:GM23131 n=1 Tax=Drosophila sechellia TaxID=7238 RepID=B4II86_DROSE|nr:GM23131 [Drosophila sechellia]